MSSVRLRGCTPRHGGASVGARAAGLAADDAAGHDPPLRVHRLRARVAPGLRPGGGAEGEAVEACAAVGVGGGRVLPPQHGPGRRWPRRVLGDREPGRPRRGPAGADQRPGPPRRRDRPGRGRARVAAHPPRRQVRHRDRRPHRRPRRDRPGPAARHGRGPLQAGVQGVARRPRPGVARPGRGRGDGRVHRVQDRDHRGAAPGGRGDGPLPRRAPRRRRPRRLPTPSPAGPARPPRPQGRPALPGEADPAHRHQPAHREAACPPRRPVRRRRPRRGRSDLGGLPAHRRRLPTPTAPTAEPRCRP